MSWRTVIEIDEQHTGLDLVTLETIRQLVRMPECREKLARGVAVELVPGVRAIAQRSDNEGLNLRIGNGLLRTTFSEPGASNVSA